MSTPTHRPVTINLNVSIDASGNVDVFSHAKPTIGSFIVPTQPLFVTSLYDEANSSGLFELWEPSNAQGTIHVQLADTDQSSFGGPNFLGAYQSSAKVIATQLQTILCDSFDCSGTAPFDSPLYKTSDKYYKQRDFGRIALATYAHYMFGHVDATAAITNDKAFVQNMLSTTQGGDDETDEGATIRANNWTKKSMINGNVQSWIDTATNFDANLAIRLVKKLVQKGLSTSDENGIPIVSVINESTDASSLAGIVAQVVGQDASRLMNVDNSERSLDRHMLLRFYPGDIIYMNITLRAPSIDIGALNPTQSPQKVKPDTLQTLYSDKNFTLKITLAGVSEEYVMNTVTQLLEEIATNPSSTTIDELKSLLGGFTTSNPAPVPTITLSDIPITGLVTSSSSSFDTSKTYDVNFVLLTNNTGVIDSTTIEENSVLYIPATTGTNVTLTIDSINYTFQMVQSGIIFNGVTYALGESIRIGNKTFILAFNGSIGFIVQDYVEHIYTNVVPEIAPDQTVIPSDSGIRYFRFDFTAPSDGSSIDVFAKTNQFSLTEEILLGIYQTSSTTNLLKTSSTITSISGITYDSVRGNIKFANNLMNTTSTPNFRINALVPGTTYSFYVRTSNNQVNMDLGLSFETNKINIPLTYGQQSNNIILPDYSARIFTNMVPETGPDGTAITPMSGTRYFKFGFTAPSDGSSIDVFAKSNLYSATEEFILGIFKENSPINHLRTSQNITSISQIVYNSISGTIIINSNQNNTIGPPNFQIHSLEPGENYVIVVRTTFNDQFSSSMDIGLLFETNTYAIPLTYIEHTTLVSSIPGSVTRSFTNVIPDVAPDGTALVTGSGLRHFRYEFTVPNNSSNIRVFTKSNSTSSSQEVIFGLYQENSTLNMLTLNLATTMIIDTTRNVIAGTLTVASNVENSLVTPSFIINSLVPGSKYVLITRTINNDVDMDVGLYFESDTEVPEMIPLTYVSTSVFGTIIPGYITRSFTNVIPDTEPSGTALTLASGIRYFRFEFTAPSNGTSIDVFARTNNVSSSEETIFGLYQSGSTTNLFRSTTATSNLSGASRNTTAGIVTLSSNLDNGTTTPNFRINTLVAGAQYILITQTSFNDVGMDVGIQLEFNSSIIPLTYVSTSLDQSIIPGGTLARTFTNVIPDTEPSGTSFSGGLSPGRHFRFEFIVPINTTSIDVFARTNTSASFDETILGLYQFGSTTNLLTNAATITSLSSTTHSTVSGSIILANSINNTTATPNFRFNSLVAGARYILITRTSFNDTGEDVGLHFVSNSIVIPLSYISSSILGTIIPGYVNRSFTNVIPDTEPNGTALTMGSGMRHFRFEFTAPSNGTSIDVFARTHPSASLQETIVGLYKSGSTTNLLTTPATITSILFITHSPSFGNIVLQSNLDNGSPIPNFRINSLVAGAQYILITRTTFNDVDADIGLQLEFNSSIIPLSYVSTSVFGTIIPGYITRSFTNVIPDTEPNGTALTLGSGTRHFRFEFTVPNNTTSINVYARTNSTSSSQETLFGLYQSGSTTNLFRSTTATAIIIGASRNTTAGTVTLSSNLDNGTTTPNLQFTSLVAGAQYILITRTSNNDVDMDVGIQLEINASIIPLTYVSTSTTTSIIPA